MKLILAYLNKSNILSTDGSGKFLEQYSSFRRDETVAVRRFKNVWPIGNQFRWFVLQTAVNQYQLAQTVCVCYVILTLSDDQAFAEKEFTLGKSSLQYNIKEESRVAEKLDEDHLQTNSIETGTFEVSSKLIISCNTTYSQCKARRCKRAKMLV